MYNQYLTCKGGGQGGIRTHGKLAPTTVFKTVALNHSATCPRWGPLSLTLAFLASGPSNRDSPLISYVAKVFG
jgi:hypothetical protein